MRPRTKESAALVLISFICFICILALAGCGGSGGGGSAATTVTISGTVMGLPNASASSISASVATATATAPLRSAASSTNGLRGKSGVTVNMYKISNLSDMENLQTGNAIAHTTTDENGEYNLPIPAGISSSSILVVAVGSGHNLMRAIFVSRDQKVSKVTDINPYSELVASAIVDYGQPLSGYSVDAIADIESQVETDAAGIDLSAETTVSAAKTKLKNNNALATHLNSAIETASGVYCGNGVIDEGEGCDGGDKCTDDCQVKTATPVCGNDVLETGEQCDDGNTVVEVCAYNETSCTVCNATCQSVAGATAYCGDGTKNGTEACDDGNTVTEACTYGSHSCTVCNETCKSVAGVTAYCGDGTENGSEACDDGNTANGDDCSSTCTIEAVNPACGNGIREDTEACDDGNTVTEACTYGQTSCTVCNASCASVAGATSYCGDGSKKGPEACDDGNTVTEACAYGSHSCTVCDANCDSVPGATAYCGDGDLNGTEPCDDGNTTTEACTYGQHSCTVCNATCHSTAGATAYCGDGTINGSEECDGSALGGETCSSQGFDGGTLSCSSCSFNTSACTTTPPVAQHFVSKWGTTGSGNGQYNNPRGLAVDNTGNVYVVDQNNNRVDVTNSDGAHIAYIGPAIAGTTNLSVPEAVCVSKVDGTIAITEQSNSRVILLSSVRTYLREFGGIGTANGQFYLPRGCTFDSNNNIYVVDDTDSPGDTINHRVQKFDINGSFLTKWGQRGTGNGDFYNPIGIVVDSNDNVYVAEATNNRIQKFTSAGVWVAKWGGTGTANGQFSFPYHLGIDSNNYIYAMDFGNDRAQVFSSSGIWLYNISSSGTADGQVTNAVGITVTPAGIVYISDWTKDNVQKFTF